MEKLETTKEEQNIFVDTDILVDYLRKREPGFSSYNKYRAKSRFLISSVSVFELMYGAFISSKSEVRALEVQSLLRNHTLVSFEPDSALMAGRIAANLRSLGKIIEIRDLFNASICLTMGAPILTKNKDHYARVAGLELLPI